MENNDAPTSLIIHVSGAGHRRAVSFLKDTGREAELHVLLPRLRAAVTDVRRTEGDDPRLSQVLRKTELDAGVHPAGAARRASTFLDAGAAVFSASPADNDTSHSGAATAATLPAAAAAANNRQHKRRRDDGHHSGDGQDRCACVQRAG
eukprot:TRINITY_DN756_c0_g1_i1.p1 TRINITY_DN756_c0_g1~~TRINITY_DN756_c0_g1_i1.p1  ORF type:complete len:149 (-),score=13.72 TRINITY_DN756_c0_g1_i1:550-996(-)